MRPYLHQSEISGFECLSKKRESTILLEKGLSGNAENPQYMVANPDVPRHILWACSHYPTAPFPSNLFYLFHIY